MNADSNAGGCVMTHSIHRVAVLGAGTMGAAVAAHAANAGLSVDLLDIVPPGAKGTERNSIVKAGFERMLKAKPAALMESSLAEHIRLGNFEDDFERLKEADWILEAILEKLEPKQELMARLEQIAHPDAIISSNTSGIPLSRITESRSEPLIGRPNTATFRLMDQVGLDIPIGVAQNLYPLIPEDPFREELLVPVPLQRMLQAGLLGLKTGSGFYKRTQRDGKTVFDVIDLETLNYRPAQQPELPIVRAAEAQGDLGARLRFLISKADEDRDARYIRDTLLPSLMYAAWRAPEIAYSLVDIDHALEWGFGQEAGPFRTWDMLGVRQTVELMEQLGLTLPPWVHEMLNKGNTSFYRSSPIDRGRDGQELV